MIGRNWVFMDSPPDEDYVLQEFIERSLPEEEIREDGGDAAEDYLSLFIDHMSQTAPVRESSSEADISFGDVEIMQSRFVSGFSDFDLSSDVNLIRLSMARIPIAGMHINNTDAVLICYTLSGEGDLVVNGRLTHCRKYDCVCVDCRRIPNFRAYPGQPWECAFVRINGRFESSLYPSLCAMIRDRGTVLLTFGAGARFRSIIWELFSMRTENNLHSGSLYNHLLLGLFLELDMAVTLASDKPAIIPDVIISLQNYLDRSYSSDINLDLLARTFNISKFHMSREFKRCIGKSPIDYLIDVRIARAKTLLSDTDRPIADICQLVGIPNPNHFLYLFKEREGVTPSAFRKFKL